MFLLCLTEKDPYPVDALPTCNHALSVCQLERKCIKLFEDFKSSCKVREGRCRMDERLVRALCGGGERDHESTVIEVVVVFVTCLAI